MADRFIRALVTIPKDSGIAEDACVNVWHFDGDDTNETFTTYTQAAHDGLTAFYQAIDQYLSVGLGPTATVRYYDLSEPEPRVPRDEKTIALTTGTGVPLPSECAICLSFQGARESGQVQRRRRGRVYLGPLDSAIGNNSGGELYIQTTVLDAIAAAASTLENGMPLPIVGAVKWAIFSRRTLELGGTLQDAFNDVTDGWVDNALDTQRRRGTAPTVRTTWT